MRIVFKAKAKVRRHIFVMGLLLRFFLLMDGCGLSAHQVGGCSCDVTEDAEYRTAASWLFLASLAVISEIFVVALAGRRPDVISSLLICL